MAECTAGQVLATVGRSFTPVFDCFLIAALSVFMCRCTPRKTAPALAEALEKVRVFGVIRMCCWGCTQEIEINSCHSPRPPHTLTPLCRRPKMEASLNQC